MMKSNAGQGKTGSERVFFWTLALFCTLLALGLEVNPFPEDGWFLSQYKLFIVKIGGDNYTPIAAPAFFYHAIHLLAQRLGLGLAAEMYIASLLQSALLFLTGWMVYRAHRLLGLGQLGMWSAGLLVLALATTFITHSFWSEAVTVPLSALTLYLAVRPYCEAGMPGPRFALLTLSFGLCLGLLTITRVVPLLILPVVTALLFLRLSRQRTAAFAVTASLLVMLMALTNMWLNLERFGRFELSNSMGRHLWNAISVEADLMLAGSREYALLKAADPEVAGKPWWEVEKDLVPEFRESSREALLRRLAFYGISERPDRLLAAAAHRAPEMLVAYSYPFGLWKGQWPGSNLLDREDFLPPLVTQLGLLKPLLEILHGPVEVLYGLLSFGLIVLLARLSWLGLKRLVKRGADVRILPESSKEVLQVWLACLLVFTAVVAAGLLIEMAEPRTKVMYYPWFALLCSLSLVIYRRTRQKGGDEVG